MTVRTLRITDERHDGRRLIYINRKRMWMCEACVDMILRLSHSNDWVTDSKLNANAGNVSRYVYKWHRELRRAGFPVKLFENDKHHCWRLAVCVNVLQYETEPGGVPGLTEVRV